MKTKRGVVVFIVVLSLFLFLNLVSGDCYTRTETDNRGRTTLYCYTGNAEWNGYVLETDNVGKKCQYSGVYECVDELGVAVRYCCQFSEELFSISTDGGGVRPLERLDHIRGCASDAEPDESGKCVDSQGVPVYAQEGIVCKDSDGNEFLVLPENENAVDCIVDTKQNVPGGVYSFKDLTITTDSLIKLDYSDNDFIGNICTPAGPGPPLTGGWCWGGRGGCMFEKGERGYGGQFDHICKDHPGYPGKGGGQITIIAQNIILDGLLSASGQSGDKGDEPACHAPNDEWGGGAGGGAGGGGRITLQTQTLGGTGIVEANGGTGGGRGKSGCNAPGLDGGAGGGGQGGLVEFIVLDSEEYEYVSGSVNLVNGIDNSHPITVNVRGGGGCCRGEEGDFFIKKELDCHEMFLGRTNPGHSEICLYDIARETYDWVPAVGNKNKIYEFMQNGKRVNVISNDATWAVCDAAGNVQTNAPTIPENGTYSLSDDSADATWDCFDQFETWFKKCPDVIASGFDVDFDQCQQGISDQWCCDRQYVDDLAYCNCRPGPLEGANNYNYDPVSPDHFVCPSGEEIDLDDYKPREPGEERVYCKEDIYTCLGEVFDTRLPCVEQGINFYNHEVCEEGQRCTGRMVNSIEGGWEGSQKLCCYGETAECVWQDDVDNVLGCEERGGYYLSENDECYGNQMGDCCFGTNAPNVPQTNIRNTAFICYQHDGNSLIMECCDTQGCENDMIYRYLTAGPGGSYHYLDALDGYDHENSLYLDYQKLLSARSTAHDAILFFDDYQFNDNDLSSFDYLEFDIGYNAEDALHKVYLNSKTSGIEVGDFAELLTDGYGTYRWHHAVIDLQKLKDEGEDLSSVDSIIITIRPEVTGVDIVYDDIIVRTKDESKATPLRYCSGVYLEWLDDLDPPTGHGGNIDILAPYRYACDNREAYHWTGTYCCGDDTDLVGKEYFADKDAGCFNGGFVEPKLPVSDALNMEDYYPDIIFDDETFYGCEGNTYDDLFVSYDGIPTSELLVTKVKGLCEQVGNFFCSNESVWENNSESMPFMHDGKFVMCVGGLMREVELKPDWYRKNLDGLCAKEYCYCPFDGKYFPECDQQKQAHPGTMSGECVQPGAYIGDHLCFLDDEVDLSARWTTRTALIARYLSEIADDQHIISCDVANIALNKPPVNLDSLSYNSFCVLSHRMGTRDSQVVVGVSLNGDVQNFLTDSIKPLYEKYWDVEQDPDLALTGDECSGLELEEGKDFYTCYEESDNLNLYYAPELQLVMFSDDSISQFGGGNFIVDFWNWLIGLFTRRVKKELELPENFNRLYINQLGSGSDDRKVMANNELVYYKGDVVENLHFKFSNFVTDLDEFTATYAGTDRDYYRLYPADQHLNILEPADPSYWTTLTTKMRIKDVDLGAPIGSTCGDGTLQDPPEECDGDVPGTRACRMDYSPVCTFVTEYCGNNVIDSPNSQGTFEECDGTDLDDKDCTDFGYDRGDLACVNCRFDFSNCMECGNGVIEGTEECDDGNTDAGDGCAPACGIEKGYECVGEPSSCTTICGDGLIIGRERCDDGNTENNDGCSSNCFIMIGWECIGQPSVCRNMCGNGRIDTILGEECETASDCGPPFPPVEGSSVSCVDCVCEYTMPEI